MDQNRKPGVPPTKDISDLKARLGLKRPDGQAPGADTGPADVRSTPARQDSGSNRAALPPPARPCRPRRPQRPRAAAPRPRA